MKRVFIQSVFNRYESSLTRRCFSTAIDHHIRHHHLPVHQQRIRLSPCEDAMAKISLLLKGSNKVTNIMILEGHYIDKETVSCAVKHLQKLHPFLRSKLVKEDQSIPHASLDRSSLLVLEMDDDLELSVAEHQSPAQEPAWQELWQRYIEKQPLQLGEGVARFDIVRSTQLDDRMALMATCEHAFCDGQSFSTLCHQLLLLISGSHISQSPSNWPPSFEQSSTSSVLPVDEKMAVRMQGLQKFPPPSGVQTFPLVAAGLTPSTLVATGTTLIRYTELSRTDSEQLLARCKEMKTTLTGAMGAAILHATAVTIAEIEGDDSQRPYKISLSCGADTRKFYTPSLSRDVLAFHVSGVPTYAVSLLSKIPQPESLWALANGYRENITDSLKHEYPLAIAEYIGKIWSNSLDPAASVIPKPITLSLTNWGALPLQKSYGNLRLVHLFPAVNLSHLAFPCVITNTVSGKLTITVLTHSTAINPEHNELLIKNIQQVLSKML